MPQKASASQVCVPSVCWVCCTALLTNYIGAITIGLIFVGLAGSLAAIYVINLRSQSTVDASITSLITALLVFVFGLTAVSGVAVCYFS